MIIISDASPLSALAQLGELDLLHPEVVIALRSKLK